ncbi:MAG: glycosyl hydrolase family 18 protein [Anaerolineales bacterium]
MTTTFHSSPTLLASSFRIVAYATESVIPKIIPYHQMTHINYAFLIPNGDGTFIPLINPRKLQQIVSDAHTYNIHVLISVGGWGADQQFERMALDPKKRSTFATNLSAFINQYHLDGADIDWEYLKSGQSSQNFLSLLKELRVALNGKLLTAAVVAYSGENGLGVPSEAFSLLNFVNVMAYDGPDHGTMDQFDRALNHWKARGLAGEKIVMGVPFYSRPSAVPYSKLVASDAAAAQVDIANYLDTVQHFNGIPTIQLKTKIAMQQAGGIMFWNLDDDAPGGLSLVQTINQTVHTP